MCGGSIDTAAIEVSNPSPFVLSLSKHVWRAVPPRSYFSTGPVERRAAFFGASASSLVIAGERVSRLA